jgi:hypothetical protein
VSVADEREWRRRSAAGQLAEAMGVPVGARCPAATVEQHVNEVRDHYRTTYARELTEREVEVLRQGAEMRYRPEPAVRAPSSVPELVQLVNSRVLGAGWRYVPNFGPGDGIAMRQPDGSFTGDPQVAAAVQAAAAAARQRMAHVTNVAIDMHIGPPT